MNRFPKSFLILVGLVLESFCLCLYAASFDSDYWVYLGGRSLHAFGGALMVSCSRAQVYDVFTSGGGRDDVMMATGMMMGVISGPLLGRRNVLE